MENEFRPFWNKFFGFDWYILSDVKGSEKKAHSDKDFSLTTYLSESI